MKVLIKPLKIILGCLAIVLTSQVYADSLSLLNLTWGYSTDGGITVTPISAVSFTGYTKVAYTDYGDDGVTDGDTFTEYSYLTATSSSDDFFDGMYATANLTGTVGSDSNVLTGILNWYANQDEDDSLPILTATLSSGNSDISADGVTEDGSYKAKVGQVTLEMTITSVAAGYFYVQDSTGAWRDLATLIGSDSSYTFTLEISSTSMVPSTITDSDKVTELLTADKSLDYALGSMADNLYGTAGKNYVPLEDGTDNGDGSITYIYTLTNTGSADMTSTQVPEPGMLSIMGLAFLGMAGLKRHAKGNRL